MTQEQAIACIIEASKSAYRRGVYSLYEAEALLLIGLHLSFLLIFI